MPQSTTGAPRESPHARAVYFAGRRIADYKEQKAEHVFMATIAAQVKMRVAKVAKGRFEYDRKQAGPKDTFRSPLNVADNRLYLRELAKAPDVSDPKLAVYQEWARGLFGVVRPARRRVSLADPGEVAVLKALAALGKCLTGANGEA